MARKKSYEYKGLICLVAVVLAAGLGSVNGDVYLYDDFSDAGESASKWVKIEYNNGLVRFGNELSRCGLGSWANSMTGMGQLDCESAWTSDWCRMDRSTPVTISEGQSFTVNWWQRWAENPGWGYAGGFALLNQAKTAIVTAGGSESVEGGHCGNPKNWVAAPSSYYSGWQHRSGWQQDTYHEGPVTLEMEISTTNVTIRSWKNGLWYGNPAWTYSTGAGVAAGTYYPVFCIWSPLNPFSEKSGVVAFDNIYFSDVEGPDFPEPTLPDPNLQEKFLLFGNQAKWQHEYPDPGLPRSSHEILPTGTDWIGFDDFNDPDFSNMKWTKDDGDNGKAFFHGEDAFNYKDTGIPYSCARLNGNTNWTTKWARFISNQNFTIDAENDFKICWQQRWDSHPSGANYAGIAITAADSETTYINAGSMGSQQKFYYDNSSHTSSQYALGNWHSCQLDISTSSVTFKGWTDGFDGTPDWTYTTGGLGAGTYNFRFFNHKIFGKDASGSSRGIVEIDTVYTNRLGASDCAEIQYLGGLGGDTNEDCTVDSEDIGWLAENWLECDDPNNPTCQ